MLRALAEYEIGGVETLVGFHQALLSHPCFRAGETCDGIVESEELAKQAEQFAHRATTLPGASDETLSELATEAEVDGRRVRVRVVVPEPPYRELARRRRDREAASAGSGSGLVLSPMQGTVIDVKVVDGDAVVAGQVVCIVEAMKMENEITADRAGVISSVAVGVGSPIAIGQAICAIGLDGAAGADGAGPC
jgi:acetyl-CoA/propionyl-CoA carboxylase biotin carboxyl carrier protein